ncbi:MAG: hypothetical protein ACFFBD_25335, partial [Candidatus Hodarchaeota archaeon]
MKEGKFKRIGKMFCQKNILVTIFAFFVGLTLQLADTTLILVILGVATVSTWWHWRPPPANVESQLILDTLVKYPAVLIKDYSHIIAFPSNPPCLAAAYQSPVPARLLKRYLNNLEGVDYTVSQMGLDTFLLLQTPLTR